MQSIINFILSHFIFRNSNKAALIQALNMLTCNRKSHAHNLAIRPLIQLPSMARWIELTTASKSVILPRSIPFDGQLPTPSTFTTPSGSTSPTTATTLMYQLQDLQLLSVPTLLPFLITPNELFFISLSIQPLLMQMHSANLHNQFVYLQALQFVDKSLQIDLILVSIPAPKFQYYIII